MKNNNSLNVYLRLCTEFYDLDKPFVAANELNFYLGYAKKANGPILEPMCGSGRFLIPMLEQGFDIEGFDASEYMLKALQQKCAKKNLKPIVSQLFLQEFTSSKKYSLIFIPSGSFGLIINPNAVKKSLRLFYDLLAPNGILIFEIDTPYALAKNYDVVQKSHVKEDGSIIQIVSETTFNKKTGIVEALCTYQHSAISSAIITEIEKYYVKLYNYDELDEILSSIGFSFKKVKAFSTETTDKFDKIIIYECTKKLEQEK